jgi:hypothetical protein
MTFEPATAANTAPMSMGYYSQEDPAGRLPAGLPSNRFRTLAQKTEDLHRLLPDSSVRLQVGSDRLAAERRLQQLTTHRPIGHGLADDDHRVVVARKELAALSAERERLVKLDTDRSGAWRRCGELLSSVRTWISSGRPPGTTMTAIDVPTPRLQKSETLPAAIDRLRQQAKELRARLAEVEQAPLPSTHVRAELREQLAAIAARGEIDVDRLFQGGQITFPETQLTMKVFNSEPAAVAIGSVPDIVGMLVHACHDSLLAAADKKLAAAGAASDARALTPEQKQKQSAQIVNELLAVETDEATLTLAAWESGLSIEANPGLAPAAWLAVRNVVAPPADTATSPQHAYTVRR